MTELLSSTAAFAPPPVPVVWRRHSFGDPIREVRVAGMSLAEIVRSLPELPRRFWEDGEIRVGEKLVPRHMWARVRPKPKADGSIDVALWLAPQGQLLRIVATIALIAAVSLVSGGALAPVFGGLFAAGTVGAAVAAAGVGILGSLAINALSPPPSTGAIDPGSQSGLGKELTPSSLQGNVLRPGASIPHVRGTRKIFPAIVVKPFVDLQGDDEVITAVIGLAGHHSMTDVSADKTPLDDLTEVTYETRSGASSDSLITLVDFQSKTDGNQIELSQHDIDPAHTNRLADQGNPDNSIPHWHAMRALGSPDEIRINLRWVQGLFDQDDPDLDIIVPVRTRVREVGTSTWINLPEVFFAFGRQKTFQKDIRIIFTAAGVLPTPPTKDGPTQAHTAVPMHVEATIGDATGPQNAFDGLTGTSASWATNVGGYIGADFGGGPRTIAYAVLEPDDVDAYGGLIDATFNLRGKNGSAPASGSNGTLLGTTGIINNVDAAGNILLTSNDTSTAWRYMWIEWGSTGGGGAGKIANVRFIGDNDYSWLANSYFWSQIIGPWHMDASNIGPTPVRRIALYPESARVYLDTGTFPKGDYEIEIKRGAVNADFNHSAYNKATGGDGHPHPDHFRYANDSGFFVVPRDYAGVYDKMVRQRFQLKWYDHPLPDAPGNLALIAVRAVNRQLGQVSCIASRYVYDWDGSGWNTLTTTSNPAPHVYDILAGDLNARPVPAELIDDANLVAWRTHAIAQGYQVNAVIEGQSGAVAAQLCAACGYARMRQSETFGVIIDKDRSLESPVQTFTARNARNYQWEKQFIEFPSGLRAIYADSTNDYEDAELIVLDPDGDQGGRYEEVRYDGFITEAEVETRALFDMDQARKRMTFHSFEANQQAIKCKRGDLIGLNHPVLTEQMGAAYIREILTDGAGNVTGFRLDGSVPTSGTDGFFSGPDEFIADLYSDGLWGLLDLGLVVRLEDGNEFTAEIALDGTGDERDSRTIILASPDTVPAGLSEGCLLTTGILGSERLRLIVGEIAPKAGDQFPQQITAVDEAPSLWS